MKDLEQCIYDHVLLEDCASKFITLNHSRKFWYSDCPFCKKGHVAFVIHCKLQRFYCFNCFISGTVIDFIIQYKHLSYNDALLFIADLYNLDVENI